MTHLTPFIFLFSFLKLPLSSDRLTVTAIKLLSYFKFWVKLKLFRLFVYRPAWVSNVCSLTETFKVETGASQAKYGDVQIDCCHSYPGQCMTPSELRCCRCTEDVRWRGLSWSGGRTGTWCTPPPADWGRGCRTSPWTSAEALRSSVLSAGSLACLGPARTKMTNVYTLYYIVIYPGLANRGSD